ncbi:Uncharacterised protein [Mycobacteroides abscessus subsp. abscessus]|nr:Uncharacterised protein [Mycobacteroides abscessus subsp. abscessus]
METAETMATEMMTPIIVTSVLLLFFFKCRNVSLFMIFMAG